VKNVRTYHRVDTLSPRRTRIQKIRRSAALEWNRIEVTREIWGVRQRQQEVIQGHIWNYAPWFGPAKW